MDDITSHKRIIVVEESRDAANLTIALLAQQDHIAIAASDGPECLALAAQLIPDAILLDLSMPEMDNFYVAEALRKHPQLHNVALIALASGIDDVTLERTEEAGFSRHLVKPISVEAIIQTVSSVT